jgi:hypothetical protein
VLCAMFTMFIAPFNFDVGKVHEDLQMKPTELQCGSVLKLQFSDSQKISCQIRALFGSTYMRQ